MDSSGFDAPAGYPWDMANIPIDETLFDSNIPLQHPDPTSYGGLSTLQTNSAPAFDLDLRGPEFSNVAISSQAGALGKRRRFDNLDWDAHQAELRQLYLIENKTLVETMEVMKDKYLFIASQKLYKNQFKRWGWNKNLPATHSRFMVDKADERSRENKDTIFFFGGQKWDREQAQASLSRNRKGQIDETGQDCPTPAGVRYRTPTNYTASDSGELFESGSSDVDAGQDIEMTNGNELVGRQRRPISSTESSNDSHVHLSQTSDITDTDKFCINSNGLTRTELLKRWEMARSLKAECKMEEAEKHFQQAIQGFDDIMGPTHADTKKVKYECANFYAETGRMADADTVLDSITREHIATWGYEHKRTQQHLLHAVELLETWKRSDDALGLLSRSKEEVEKLQHGRQGCSTTAAKDTIHRGDREGDNVQDLVKDLTQNGSRAKVDYGMGIAKSHAKANHKAAGDLLRAIIRHCDSHPEGLAVQHLHALAELISLEKRLRKTAMYAMVVSSAEQTLKRIWKDYDWYEEKFQCLELMEAAMQLASNLLKTCHTIVATRIFREVDDKAKVVFGSDDERTIWILITIGLAYQKHISWKEAEEWFEGAFAAALASGKWRSEDGIVKSLQNAMDKRHFSYLSDEGRPFKTIFGVSGISIQPGRLHLE